MKHFGSLLVFPEGKRCPNCEGAGCPDCRPSGKRQPVREGFTPVVRVFPVDPRERAARCGVTT